VVDVTPEGELAVNVTCAVADPELLGDVVVMERFRVFGVVKGPAVPVAPAPPTESHAVSPKLYDTLVLYVIAAPDEPTWTLPLQSLLGLSATELLDSEKEG
jgi:hypothetical protein